MPEKVRIHAIVLMIEFNSQQGLSKEILLEDQK